MTSPMKRHGTPGDGRGGNDGKKIRWGAALQEIHDQLHLLSLQAERIAAAAGAVPGEVFLVAAGEDTFVVDETALAGYGAVPCLPAGPSRLSRLAREMRQLVEQCHRYPDVPDQPAP